MRTAKPKGEIGSRMTDFVWLCWFAVSPEANILLEQSAFCFHSQQDKVQTTRAGTRGPSLSSPNSPFSSLLGSCSQPHSQPENSMQSPNSPCLFLPLCLGICYSFCPWHASRHQHLDNNSIPFSNMSDFLFHSQDFCSPCRESFC